MANSDDSHMGLAIDHGVANSRFMDHSLALEVAHDRLISDHYPLVGKWRCYRETVQCWVWPAPMHVCGQPKKKLEWCCNPATFAEWEEYAAKWISDSFQAPLKKKALLPSQIWNPAPLPVDTCYATIISAMRALDTILRTETPSARQLCSLATKLAELDIPLEPLDSVLPALKNALSRLVDSKQKQALARSRKHVATWHLL